MSWEPEVLSPSARQALLSGLGLLRGGLETDFTTRLIPRCSPHLKDVERARLAAEFKKYLSWDLHPAHFAAEVRQESKHGTYSRRPPFSVPDDTGISMELLVRRISLPTPALLQVMQFSMLMMPWTS